MHSVGGWSSHRPVHDKPPTMYQSFLPEPEIKLLFFYIFCIDIALQLLLHVEGYWLRLQIWSRWSWGSKPSNHKQMLCRSADSNYLFQFCLHAIQINTLQCQDARFHKLLSLVRKVFDANCDKRNGRLGEVRDHYIFWAIQTQSLMSKCNTLLPWASMTPVAKIQTAEMTGACILAGSRSNAVYGGA